MATDAESSKTEAAGRRPAGIRLGLVEDFSRLTGVDSRMLAMLGAMVVIWLVLDLMTDGLFLTPRNLFNLAVQGSAVGIYGARGDEEVSEEGAPADDFLATLCREWEAASASVEAAGVRRAVVRSGVVLSTRGGALPQMALPFKLFAGGPVGHGRQWVPWVHLDDEVGAIHFLLGRPQARGAFNLVAPQPVRNRDLAKTLGRVLRRPAWLPAPAFALRLLFGEMASVLLEGQRAVPTRLTEAGYAFRYPDLEGALRDLYA